MSDDAHHVGDEPIQQELKAQMNTVAKMIDEHLNGHAHCTNPRFGFVILAFPMTDEGRCNYIGNVPPDQMKYLIVDQADKIIEAEEQRLAEIRRGSDDADV